MKLRIGQLPTIIGCVAVLAAAPSAGAGVLKIVPGTITNLAADGADVAYVTNLYSKACMSPGGDPQQVVYLNAKTGKSVVLTTEKGCDTLTGPGLFLDTDRWLGISRKHVYWIEASYSGDNTYIGIDVATPGTKPVRGPLNSHGRMTNNPLLAWGGRGYQASSILADASSCGSPGGCVFTPALDSYDAAGGKQTTPLAGVGDGEILQAVNGNGALLLDPKGALTIANAATSTPLAGSLVAEAAMSGSTIVGVTHAGAKVKLSFWNTSGAKTGSCTASTGSNTAGVAIAGRIAAFATNRGIYAVKAPTGTKAACGATKLVSFKGARLAGFALSAAGGLVYATNQGTSRGVLSRLTPADVKAVGYTLR